METRQNSTPGPNAGALVGKMICTRDKAFNMDKKQQSQTSPDRDQTSESLARQVPPEQSDDLFTDRGAQDVSSPAGDSDGENKVATSLDDE